MRILLSILALIAGVWAFALMAMGVVIDQLLFFTLVVAFFATIITGALQGISGTRDEGRSIEEHGTGS